jgi:hypothetical protein
MMFRAAYLSSLRLLRKRLAHQACVIRHDSYPDYRSSIYSSIVSTIVLYLLLFNRIPFIFTRPLVLFSDTVKGSPTTLGTRPRRYPTVDPTHSIHRTAPQTVRPIFLSNPCPPFVIRLTRANHTPAFSPACRHYAKPHSQITCPESSLYSRVPNQWSFLHSSAH